ncbi:Pisatin demethylase [Cytospora mali]|uniref:Pisatin demethylase n=1 Tax=Cytospora mali TaxID=578113 RepID=A0A194UV81_CYTMA|nr:Pisatin demethylase [Valsa mali var. pyri (nom. inval.)]
MTLEHFVSNVVADAQRMDLESKRATLITSALLLVFLYLAVTRFMTWRRLSAFHGPLFASISYLPMLRLRRSGRSHLEYFNLSKKHGPLVRIGPNDLLASNPDHLRRMSAVRSTYERSSWYKATRLDPYHDMMGSVMDKSAHMAIRSKLAAGYTGKDNPGLEAGIDSTIQTLVELIRREYLSEETVEPVDFGRLADFYAHDSKSMLAFGKPIGLLKNNNDVRGIIAIVKLALEWIQVFTDIPPLQKIFLSDVVLKLFGPKPTDSWGVGYLMGMAQEVVASRFQPDAKDKQDLLGSFLRHGLDRRSAESEAMFPIIAGSDTTANAIKMTVAHIAANPNVAIKLRNEIKAAISDGRISSPVTNAEATQLPYLQAVIMEGLRVHPPFGGLIMKAVGPDGDMFDGKFLPAGTRIGHSTWAVTHEISVFGADADVFRPERWLEADEKTRATMRKQTELVFGSGRWGCPGKTVAFIELNKVMVALFRNFDFHLIDTPASRKESHVFLDGSLPMTVTNCTA